MRRIILAAVPLAFIFPHARAELVHYYTFDSQTARDAVGGNDGAISGNPDFVPGPSGEDDDWAINLNEEGTGAQDDFVEFEATEFGDAFTLAAWIKPIDVDQSNQMMAIAANTHGGFRGPDGFKWVVNQWNDRDESLRLETGDTADGTNNGFPGTVFLDEEWQHVAISFDKEALRFEMFYGGLILGSGGILDFSDGLPWRIGNFMDPPNAGFIGAIDSFAVFDEALSEAEITDIFENGIDVPDGMPGDFNLDGELTGTDIDLLSDEVRAGSNNPFFDLNNDGSVNQSDRLMWVREIKRTYLGDSNLDLEFSSTDFVTVFQAGQYEDAVAQNSRWETGDWNGDKDFNSSDFVSAFQDGGYEQGPRPASHSVPEPASIWLVGFAIYGLSRIRLRDDRH